MPKSYIYTFYLFNVLYELSHGTNPPPSSPRVQDKMAGTTSIIKGVLADFLTLILPKIGGDPRREALIELHWLISVNLESGESNLGGGPNGHLTLTITAQYYMAQTGYAFVTPHNSGYFPPTIGTAQEQLIRTERLQKNQAPFRICTAVDGAN